MRGGEVKCAGEHSHKVHGDAEGKEEKRRREDQAQKRDGQLRRGQ